MEGLKADAVLYSDFRICVRKRITAYAMYIDGGGVLVLHLGREFKLILIHCYLDLPTAVSKIITWQGTLENTFIFRILSNFLVRCPDASTCR